MREVKIPIHRMKEASDWVLTMFGGVRLRTVGKVLTFKFRDDIAIKDIVYFKLLFGENTPQ